MTKPYPLTAAERGKARAKWRREIIADAEARAAVAGSSLRCEAGDHRRRINGYYDGCRNDGTGCLCECHDPKGTP